MNESLFVIANVKFFKQLAPSSFLYTGVLIFPNPTPIILTKLNDDLKNRQPGYYVDNRLSGGEKLVQKEKVFGNEF